MVRLFCLIYHDHEVAALHNASFICLCILNLHTLYNRIYELNSTYSQKRSNYLATQQWWANLDQASKDLDKTIFRDLSPTPIP